MAMLTVATLTRATLTRAALSMATLTMAPARSHASPSPPPLRLQVVPVAKVAPRLRERLCLDLPDAEFEAEAMRIVNSAANHKGTAYYDKAQNMQRGIAI